MYLRPLLFLPTGTGRRPCLPRSYTKAKHDFPDVIIAVVSRMVRFGPELKAIFFSHAVDTSFIILVRAYRREVLETLWYSGKITRTRNHEILVECLSTWTNGQATGYH